MSDTKEALRRLVNALRDRHYGRMPDEVQRAYDNALAALAAPPATPAAQPAETYRAALERIAAIEDQMCGGDWDEIEEARQIARAALEG